MKEMQIMVSLLQEIDLGAVLMLSFPQSIHGFIRYEDNANVDQTILEITETFNEM